MSLLSLCPSSAAFTNVATSQQRQQRSLQQDTSLAAATSSDTQNKRKCPFAPPSPETQVSRAATANDKFFPNRLNLRILQQQGLNDPDPDFDYAKAFASLDLKEVKKDIEQVITTSQDFWPAGELFSALCVQNGFHNSLFLIV